MVRRVGVDAVCSGGEDAMLRVVVVVVVVVNSECCCRTGVVEEVSIMQNRSR